MTQVYSHQQSEFKLDKNCDSQELPSVTVQTELEQQPCNITFTSIDGFYNHEALVNNNVIATLDHDPFVIAKNWVVSIAGVEMYRGADYSDACSWVEKNYFSGTLPAPAQVLSVGGCKVDASYDSDFGTLYRVTKHNHFLGSFYQNHYCEWVVQTRLGENSVIVLSASIAQLTLLSLHERSNCVELEPNIDSLLDKPFDELTATEWQRLMAHSPIENHLEVAAA